jgi:hypothetical protein
VTCIVVNGQQGTCIVVNGHEGMSMEAIRKPYGSRTMLIEVGNDNVKTKKVSYNRRDLAVDYSLSHRCL